MASKLIKEEQKWQAEDDARTLANAAAIKSDKGRMSKAKTAAKGMAAEEQKRASDARARATQMTKLAKTKTTRKTAARSRTTPKTKARATRTRRRK